METQLEIFPTQNGMSSNPVVIIKKTHVFQLIWLKMVLRDMFPPIGLQIRMGWVCF